jgi:hypothetical protein
MATGQASVDYAGDLAVPNADAMALTGAGKCEAQNIVVD